MIPHRYWLTVAGTACTLLDTTDPKHRGWLEVLADRLLRAFGHTGPPIKALYKFGPAPYQWTRPVSCIVRPATDAEADAILRPLETTR